MKRHRILETELVSPNPILPPPSPLPYPSPSISSTQSPTPPPPECCMTTILHVYMYVYKITLTFRMTYFQNQYTSSFLPFLPPPQIYIAEWSPLFLAPFFRPNFTHLMTTIYVCDLPRLNFLYTFFQKTSQALHPSSVCYRNHLF